MIWVREMTEEEIQDIGDNGPAIDSIEVAEFDSQKAVKDWVRNKAPAFVRGEQ